MNSDALWLLGLVIALAPAFARSLKSFSIAAALAFVVLVLLTAAMLDSPAIGYGPTLAKAVGAALTGAVFVVTCGVRGMLLLVRAKRATTQADETRPRR